MSLSFWYYGKVSRWLDNAKLNAYLRVANQYELVELASLELSSLFALLMLARFGLPSGDESSPRVSDASGSIGAIFGGDFCSGDFGDIWMGRGRTD